MRHSLRTLLLSTALAAVVVLNEPIRGALLAILRFPLTTVRFAVSVALTLPRLPSLARENNALRAELAQHQRETAQLQEQLRHVQQRDALLHVPSASRGVVATILTRSILPTQHVVVLDRGGRDGLTVDSAILDAFGLIGRVTEVRPSSALVTLLTDPESRIAALVERSRETGLLVGRGRGLCELIYLDVQADLREGDRIVTAGLGGSLPKGLLLGIANRIVRDEQAGTTSAWVVPAAHLGQLEEVLCLPAPRPPLPSRASSRPPGPPSTNRARVPRL